jgi:hypothetical protein
MFSRVLKVTKALSLPSFARYLIEELFANESGLASRICRHRMASSWPSLSRLLISSSRSVVSA